MKRKKHIPVLILAAFFAVVSNGLPVYEHLCRTSQSISFGILDKPTCEMEAQVTDCCGKKAVQAKKTADPDCCEHKSFFSKFQYEGFTTKFFSLDMFDILQFIYDHLGIDLHIPTMEDLFTGLSPPYPDYEIAQYLQPTQPELQVFIC